jgi:hypothetical protein
MPRLLAVAITALALGATAPAIARAPTARHYLDRQTGATVTAMEQAFVFARERPAVAVNARDYTSLIAIDINRGGQHQLYWYGYSWSTIDGDDQATGSGTPATWLLLADGRPIALRPAAQTPAQVGIGKTPLARPVRKARTVLFEANAEELEFIGRATDLSLERADDGSGFVLWRDARDALQALLAARLR